jgi:hypothetical protein
MIELAPLDVAERFMGSCGEEKTSVTDGCLRGGDTAGECGGWVASWEEKPGGRCLCLLASNLRVGDARARDDGCHTETQVHRVA